MSLFSLSKTANEKEVKILGITVYKKSLVHYKNKVWTKRKLLFGLFKSLENFECKIFYILGIRIFKKKNDNTNMIYKKLNAKLDDIYYDMYVLNQVKTLHEHFLQYKRCNEGKYVVLVATGPSAMYYKNLIPNALHLSVNASIYYDWIKFDYAFANDAFTVNPRLNDDIDNYRPNFCKKFYAIHSKRRLTINQKNGMKIDRIAQYHFYKANAKPYLLQDAPTKLWAVNLECEPFGDIGSTVFSAMQFILYTNPKKIYLVGCDCSISKSESSANLINYQYLLKYWKNLKLFAKTIYPNIEIISINPVGLKGLFTDIYTTDNGSYVDSNGNKVC